MQSLSLSDLEAIDTTACTALSAAQEDALVRQVRRAAGRVVPWHDLSWSIDPPGAHQDGALATVLSVHGSGSGTDFLFSTIGGLVTIERSRGCGSSVDASCVEELLAVLQSDHGFRFVSPLVLRARYAGVFSRYPMGTWFQRLFCAVYWGNARSHEGAPRWP